MNGESVFEGFGDRVRALREAKGWNQTQLAEDVGVALSAVTDWETKKRLPRDPNVLVRLAETLGCSLDFLLRDEEGLQELVRRRLSELLTEIGPAPHRPEDGMLVDVSDDLRRAGKRHRRDGTNR